jgi:hypothetical protein
MEDEMSEEKTVAIAIELGSKAADVLESVSKADVVSWPPASDPKGVSQFAEDIDKILKEKPPLCIRCERSFEGSKPDGIGAIVRMWKQKQKGCLYFLVCHECAQQPTADELIKSAIERLGAQLLIDWPTGPRIAAGEN